MADQEHAHHPSHHAFGHHGGEDKKEQKSAMYWGLGIAAAGLVVTVLFLGSGNQKKQQGTNTVVQPSEPFIPNPTDVSTGTEPLFWPGLPTSGTPSKPKTHHQGDKDKSKDKNKKKKEHDHTTPNDHKGYGGSPRGSTHGHTVSGHHTNHPTVHSGSSGHTKGKANG